MLRRVITCAPLCVLICAALPMSGQTDPGPQPGPPAAGRPLPGLTPQENGTFQQGQRRFNALVTVQGTQPGAQRSGLGPRFNLNSCAGCHAQPAAGGSSPSANPQI